MSTFECAFHDPSDHAPSLSATCHLLELGHRRIAAITGPARVLSSRARLDGYRAALDSAGVALDPKLIREGDFHVEDGLAHTRDLLRMRNPPTAIFAFNDGQALGVYQAAAAAGSAFRRSSAWSASTTCRRCSGRSPPSPRSVSR